MADSGFKISELPLIKNIDNDDLLIVSDRDGGSNGNKKYYTRSMSIQQLVQVVVDKIASSPKIIDQITASAVVAATEAAIQQVDKIVVPDKVVDVIQQNYLSVLDALDGQMDGEFRVGTNEGSTST